MLSRFKITKNKSLIGICFLLVFLYTLFFAYFNNFLDSNVYVLATLVSIGISYLFVLCIKNLLIKNTSIKSLLKSILFLFIFLGIYIFALYLLPSEYISQTDFFLKNHGWPLFGVKTLFGQIFINNIFVLLSSFILSLISPLFVVFILLLNATNIYVFAYGEGVVTAITLLPHSFLELTSFFLASVSGIYLVFNLKNINKNTFLQITRTTILLLILSVFTLYISAIVEVYIATHYFF